MAFYKELEGQTLASLADVYWGASIVGEDPYTFQMEVAFTIAKDPGGREFLRSALDQSDGPRFAATLLAYAETFALDDALRQRVRGLLRDVEPRVRLSALEAMRHDGDWCLTDEVELMLEDDPDGVVRAACLRYLAAVRPGDVMKLLSRWSADPDPLVRCKVVDLLGERREADALPLLHVLLTDADPDVRKAAEHELEWW
jgi:HEAT repeat protein